MKTVIELTEEEQGGFSGSVTPAAILKVLPNIENPKLFIKAFLKIKKGSDLTRLENEVLANAFVSLLKLGTKETQKVLTLFKKIEG